jgi:hypothetical protein
MKSDVQTDLTTWLGKDGIEMKEAVLANIRFGAGRLPQYSLGGGAVPFLQIPGQPTGDGGRR